MAELDLGRVVGRDGQDGQGVPPGGTAGQVLKKRSATNYDAEWGNEDLGLTGAAVGDLVRVNAVDAQGRPTSWARFDSSTLLSVEAGTVTLTNNQVFPFNNSQVTVPLVTTRNNQNYIVDYEVTAAVGNVGDIIVSAKLVNGFKIEYTGSATSVTVKYQVLGGMS